MDSGDDAVGTGAGYARYELSLEGESAHIAVTREVRICRIFRWRCSFPKPQELTIWIRSCL